MMERLLDRWQVERKQRRALLALGSEHFPRFLALDAKLHLLLPHNALMADLWPTTPTPFLAGQSPVESVCERGLAGLEAVEAFVDDDLQRLR